MVSYSVNRSINISPTSGRLHKHRESTSLGPTICLVNRSRSKIEESTVVEDRGEQELITKIFMMSMEIDRLSEHNRSLLVEKEQWSSIDKSKEVSQLKDHNDRLKMSAERSDNTRIEL